VSQVVLITGCSTGIGRDLAQHLTEAGYIVVATAGTVETLDNLQSALKLPLDVTQQDSINNAVSLTLEKFERIDVLINNAGYAVRGALEEVPDEQVRQVFDVNVFGTLRMIRAIAPLMRKKRMGRIINISSIAGKMSTPVNGAYSSTKFALEALSDALRLELAPFGVHVISIEPGAIKTQFDKTALSFAQQILSNKNSPDQSLYQNSHEFAASMRQQEVNAGVVSQVIQEAIESPNPKARYLAGVAFSGQLVLHLRDFVWDSVLKRMFLFVPQKEIR
jgi:NAD(P)-dependent dehydrogenase (short-subunit alcohol dehydrogenase family)